MSEEIRDTGDAGQTLRQVVLATGNVGKLREFQALFRPLNIDPVLQSSLGVKQVDETGLTFIENALLKARHAALCTNQPALADDSGLAVDALHGAPGIYSARYAGAGADDQANLRKLLQDLRDVRADVRTARFHCVLVYMRDGHDQAPIVCHAQWEGRIAREPRGVHGFGYDPIFYVPTHDCTSAELPENVKNAISHRGQALRALVDNLRLLGIAPPTPL